MEPYLGAYSALARLRPKQKEEEIPEPVTPELPSAAEIPEADPSLVAQAGDVALSGLSAVGNLLGLPGSMVTDALSGSNPFDQLLTPFSDKNRKDGREMFRAWGLAGEEDTWGNFGAGLAADILLDPVTWMTFGGSALTKGGKALSKVDKLKDIKQVATDLTGKKTGSATARQQLTPKTVLEYRARQAAKTVTDDTPTADFDALYKSAYDDLLGKFKKAGGTDDMLNQSIGGEIGFGLPFRSPSYVWGAKKHADDHLQQGLASIKPGRKNATTTPPSPTPGASTAAPSATAQATPTLSQSAYAGANAARQFTRNHATQKLAQDIALDTDEIKRIYGTLDDEGKDAFIGEMKAMNLLPKTFKKTAKTANIDDITAKMGTFADALVEDDWKNLSSLQDLTPPPSAAQAPPPSAIPSQSQAAAPTTLAGKAASSLKSMAGNSKSILQSIKKDLPGKTAAAKDAVFGWAGGTLPARIAGSLFIPERRGQVQDFAIETAIKTDAVIEDALKRSREAAHPFIKKWQESGIFDENKIMAASKIADRDKAIDIANRRHATLVDQLESLDDQELADLIAKERQMGNDSYAQALEAGQGIRNLMTKTLDELQATGVPVEELREDYIKVFLPRRAHSPGKQTARYSPARGQLVDNANPSLMGRKLDDIPGRTRVLNEISTDKELSGKRTRMLVEGKELTPQELADARSLLITKYGRELIDEVALKNAKDEFKAARKKLRKAEKSFEAFVANKPSKKALESATKKMDAIKERHRIAKAELDEVKATNKARVDKVLGWAIDLDPYYANYKLPFFGRNLINPVMDYLEGMYRVQGNVRFLRNLIRETAQPIRTYAQQSGASPKAIKQAFPETRALKGERLGDILEANKVARLRTLEKIIDQDLGDMTRPIRDEVEQLADARALDPKAVVPDDLEKAVETLQSIRSNEAILAKAQQTGMTPQKMPLNPKRLQKLQDNINAAKERYYKEVLNLVEIPTSMGDAITKYLAPTRNSEELRPIVDSYDRYNSMFRAGATAVWPAFHIRNLTSGQANNLMAGHYDLMGEAGIAQSIKDAHALYTGGTIKGLGKKLGVASDEEATNLLRQYVFANGLIGGRRGISSELIGDSMESYAQQIPGLANPNVLKGEFTPAPPGTRWRDALNPFNSRNAVNPIETAQDAIRGFKTKQQLDRLTASNQDQFIGTRFGQDVGNQVEAYNRLAPMIALIKKGYDPDVAAQMVKDTQVDYTKLSQFEKDYMRRLMPFYTFSRRNAEWVGNELTQRPGGPMGQIIQATNSMRDKESPAPDYITESASIPLGKLGDGSQRYLTGFGLSFEDPLQFAGLLRGDIQQPLRELGSRLNPLLKGTIETMTGQSLFQSGPFGGRALEDLDPPVGRTLQNLSDLATGERTQVAEPFVSRGLEFAISNSPFARAANFARTVTDPRKLENPLGLGLNTLTGFRVSDVSPGAQDAILRERAAKLMKDLGGLTYRRPYMPEGRVKKLSPEELQLFEELQGLLKTLDQRAKLRREAQQSLPNPLLQG